MRSMSDPRPDSSPTGSPEVFLMEDHCDSYPFWRERSLRGGICVHLDAHLDLSDEGFPTEVMDAIRQTESADALRAFRSNPHLPWGGYHAGNYLYPALLDGTVSSIYWVIPPWLPRGRGLLEWTRGELQNWYQVTLDDYASLRLVDRRVEGTILGRPFTLCTIENLPRLDAPVLLDIDVDYFLDHDDSLFEAPDAILDALHQRLARPTATTVSYSVNGGYTPLEHRYVGEVLQAGAHQAARAAMRGDRLRAAGDTAGAVRAYEGLVEQGFKAAGHYKLSLAMEAAGRPDEARHHAIEAAATDEHYRPRAVDIAFLHFRRRDYRPTVEWLRRARDEDPLDAPLTLYIEGLAHLREGQHTAAIDCFERVLDEPALRPQERAYICTMLGRTLLREGRREDALTALRRAVADDPKSGLYHIHLAHGLRELRLLDEAARHYRKAITLAGGTLASLEAHRSLAAVYEASGQRLLADAELRRLQAKDVVGTFSMRAMLNRKGDPA